MRLNLGHLRNGSESKWMGQVIEKDQLQDKVCHVKIMGFPSCELEGPESPTLLFLMGVISHINYVQQITIVN